MRKLRKTELGAEVLRRREEAGWSQEDLAQRLGITRVAVSDLERGATLRPRNEVLRKLESTLGLSRVRAYELIGDVPLSERPDPVVLLTQAAAHKDRGKRIEAWNTLPSELKQAVATLFNDVLTGHVLPVPGEEAGNANP